MENKFRNTVMATWIFVGGMGEMSKAGSARAADANLKITVHLRNYAQVEAKILRKASAIASRIFQKAGVEAIVVDQSESGEMAPPGDTTLRLTHLYVDILPREMAQTLGLPTKFLGLAPGTSQEHNRTKLFIFDHAANELVRQQRVASKAYILGYAVAHEIGHILLHLDAHTETGIMMAKWDQKTMWQVAKGVLVFASEEVARIQEEVARRNQQDAAVQLAAQR